MNENPFQPTAPRCETCRFWDRINDTYSGECRRYAPRPNAEQIKLGNAGNKHPEFRRGNWVWTAADDWCGEYSEALDR